MTDPTRRRIVFIAVVLAIAGVLDAIVAARMSPTRDEGTHVAYGLEVLHGRPERDQDVFDGTVPISALNAVPRLAAEQLEARGLLPRAAKALRHFKLARAASVVSLLVLDLVICLWATELYGPVAGGAALLLAMLAPNLVAHGTLATVDGYFALGVLLSLLALRRYLRRPTTANAWLSAGILALAQITKPFAFYLYVIAAAAVAAAALRPSRGGTGLVPRGVALYATACVVTVVLVLNVGYGFDRSFTRFGSYRFESAPLVRLQHAVARVPALSRVPVPVPYPYLQGLDLVASHEARGGSYGNIYLLGQLRSSSDPRVPGFRSYYAVAFFFKEPIALQILFLSGLIELGRRRSLADFVRGEGLLLGAAGTLVVWLSFFSKAQIGIRHILPALAVVVVIAAAPFARFPSLPRWGRVGLGLLVVWLGLSTFSYYPHLIPYMNEWAGDRRFAYRLLADSNLDWGQNDYLVKEFLRKNPDVALNPHTPVCGRFLMSANRLTGVAPWPEDRVEHSWAWSYEPIAQVGYAHFLFRGSPEGTGCNGAAAPLR